MARGINKAILIGNLGSDPETKYTQGGTAITKVSVATTSVRKDKDGEAVESTQWHRVTFFGKLAEIAGEYLSKGSQVYIEGEIRYDKYTDSNGVEKFFTEIVAFQMQMLGGGGGRREDRGGGDHSDAGGASRGSRRPSGGTRRAPAQRREPSNREPPRQQQFDDDFEDDDIPF